MTLRPYCNLEPHKHENTNRILEDGNHRTTFPSTPVTDVGLKSRQSNLG